MKKFISVLLVFILAFLCMSITSFAKTGVTYYVDSTWGNDEYSGLGERSAWKTLEKASSVTYNPGDKILFKAGGIYEGTFTAHGNGTKENPITVSSYGDIKKDGLPVFTTLEDKNIFLIHNVSGWIVENIEMTSPNGKGLLVLSDGGEVIKDIVVRNCVLHDIYFKPMPNAWGDQSRASVRLCSSGKGSRIDNLTLSGLNIYDCAYGVMSAGTNIEYTPNDYVSPEVSYNQNFLFEDMTLNNILYDGIGGGAINGYIVRNSSLINTSLREDWPTAPTWSHHVKHMLIENCEIAGATNRKDGMAVDFDGWTTDSMYQYIYSHDNVSFIHNCVYDNTTKNANCTVRYCLSVNDNKNVNTFAQLMESGGYDHSIRNDESKYIDNFKFYNNTIINGSDYRMAQVHGSYVANNIFYSDNVEQFFLYGCLGKTDDGKLFIREFDGEFTNNCFFGCSIPLQADNSVNKNPLFVGTDITDPESFKLSKNSPLLGKGVQVEEDMGEYDFYGNKLTDTHNIGCYDGPGEDVEIEKTVGDKFEDFFKIMSGYIVGIFKMIVEAF